ncbi:MAG: BolA/IbaG family iron-sulfur metabolism protein, partial [Pseudomonadota bacterium]
MVTAESIQTHIETALPCELVQVEGDGHHFNAIIVSAEFRGKNMVQQHQLVYRALGDRMKQEIHALSMKTLT